MRKTHMSKEEVASLLEEFLEDRGGEWDWDDFISATELDDEELESIRCRCISLSKEFPPEKPNEYCNEEGLHVIRKYVKVLRA